MIVNFRIRKISRGARKLIRTSTFRGKDMGGWQRSGPYKDFFSSPLLNNINIFSLNNKSVFGIVVVVLKKLFYKKYF